MANAINTLQPSLGLTQYILKSGVYPVRSDGSGLDGGPFGSILGSIHSFAGNFSPVGNPATDGGVVAIAQNTALFTLLVTNFGGNGTTTFQVPNLGGKLAGGDGGTGGTAGVGTQSGGPVNLLQSQLPASSGGTSAAVSDIQPTLTIKYGIAVTAPARRKAA